MRSYKVDMENGDSMHSHWYRDSHVINISVPIGPFSGLKTEEFIQKTARFERIEHSHWSSEGHMTYTSSLLVLLVHFQD